ncbi:hypothetical protein B8A09_12215 [Staphylococcus aureus]|nr:hypothetical protein B8A09_12215 [Staphylococcus aureus]
MYFVVPPQLALPVEFLFEILCVGAHTPTCTLLKADYWPASVLGPLPQLAHY